MASSLETNKVLAALLTAGIIASGSGVISRIIYHPSMPEENAYSIEVPEAEAAAGEGAAEAEARRCRAARRGEPRGGPGEAKKCAACHTFEQGGAAKIGPPLWGVVGRDIASVAGFAYSDALLEQEGDLDLRGAERLPGQSQGLGAGHQDGLRRHQGSRGSRRRHRLSALARREPRAAARGAAAAAAARPGRRRAAAAEGRSRRRSRGGRERAGAAAAEPARAGARPCEAPPSAPARAARGDGIGALLAHADVDAGAKSARKCAACHSFEEGGAAKIGPPLWGVVGRDIASPGGLLLLRRARRQGGRVELSEPRRVSDAARGNGRPAPRWPSPGSRSPRSAPT